jgi:hypothetical protein
LANKFNANNVNKRKEEGRSNRENGHIRYGKELFCGILYLQADASIVPRSQMIMQSRLKRSPRAKKVFSI